MQFLDLPLDIFKIVIAFTVQDLGLKQSMKARLTCRMSCLRHKYPSPTSPPSQCTSTNSPPFTGILADEILDAVIKTRVIEEVQEKHPQIIYRLEHHHNVIARYLYHRVRTDGPITHSWITTIRETCLNLVQNTNSENDTGRMEQLQRSACMCLAVREGASVFEKLSKEEVELSPEFEVGRALANSLTLAAWVGDKTLVESLRNSPEWLDPDPDMQSFFGRPSWAAATQGHAEIAQVFLDHGALSYQPGFFNGPSFEISKTTLGAAAYMGHENITRLYLQPQYYHAEMRPEIRAAIIYAAEANQPTTLKYLLEHYKDTSTPLEFLGAIDTGLVVSCRRGAPISVRILLDYGADVDESDAVPHSCLQLAAVAGDTQVVKMLLDAGASLKPKSWVYRRTCTTSTCCHQQKRLQPSALREAGRRDNHAITKLIADKQQELDDGGSQAPRVRKLPPNACIHSKKQEL